MNQTIRYEDAVSQLAAQADAAGRLAQDAGAFAAVAAAFESQDPNAFRWVLGRLEMLPRCELICEWVRIKLCVLRCNEVCGPFLEDSELPSLQLFARAIVRLAADEKLLRRVVDAVTCGDGEDYRAAIGELELEPFCHLICRWVCAIIYGRICEVVCTPQFIPLADPLGEIRAAAKIMASLVDDTRLFDEIGKAAVSLNCEIVQTAIDRAGAAGQCEIICQVICTWRCAWVCREFCRRPSPIFTGVLAIEEARNFALASRRLVDQPRALGDLVIAAQNRDAQAYGAILERYGLEAYCEQVCAWVCSASCVEFCRCVCPPPPLLPYFFKIGGLDYQTQVDSVLPATGLTVGLTQAFYSALRLNGILTKTLGGLPLEYSFEFAPVTLASTSLAAAAGATDTTLTVASITGFPTTVPFNVSLGAAAGGYEIVTVTHVAATTWTVERGQQGTTAAAAAVGATIVTGAASGSWTQVPQAWIERTVIGTAEVFVPLPTPHLDFIPVALKPNPGDIAVTVTGDGWIQVPQGANVSLSNDMIVLDSRQLAAFTAADETGVSASNPVNGPAPTDHYFGIRMRVRQQGSTTDSDGGTCSVVAIDNTLYNHIDRHPEWAGGVLPDGQYGVAMLDIAELQAAGCAGITDSLTVLFTASHPNLGPVSIGMIGGTSGPFSFTLPTPVPQTGDWYGTAINDFTLADLEPCAYLVTLSVSLLLTTGDGDFPSPLIDQIAFCLS